VRFTLIDNTGKTSNQPIAVVIQDLPAVITRRRFDPIFDPSSVRQFWNATVSLIGITAGRVQTQNLTATATSSNPALVPDPAISYTSPNSTGSLRYTPTGTLTGTAVITVTVKATAGTAGGGVDTVTRSFTVTVGPVANSAVARHDLRASVRSGRCRARQDDQPHRHLGGQRRIADRYRSRHVERSRLAPIQRSVTPVPTASPRCCYKAGRGTKRVGHDHIG